MQPPYQHQRINLAELKAQIFKKLGPEGSKQYIYYLNKYLNLKLSKIEFNKLCLPIIGRENIPLHNRFIHSILKNAFNAKVPPTHDKEINKPVKAIGKIEFIGDGLKQSLINASVLSNGDVPPSSPRKIRTGACERKVLDHRGTFGSNGKTNIVSHHLSVERDSNSNVLENGVLAPHDIREPVQHHQGLKEQIDNDEKVPHFHSAQLSIIKGFPDRSAAVHSKDLAEAIALEDSKGVSARILLHAPLGIPCCPVSVGGARRTIPLASSSECASSINFGGLLDTTTLRERMEQMALTQGLKGVSVDSANLMNNGLDAYLKGLIASCIDLVGARSGNEPMENRNHKHQAHLKLFNSVRPNYDHRMESTSKLIKGSQEKASPYPVSLLDFRVAMELQPQQLGEDWPSLLERICAHEVEE